ncbi:phenylacetate--CoA ligase family protein [Streptomyces sp. DH37]|uniref:phenylacetate--CoA ligase family protein n=1 Tax=Streptomyces sp. DH37 TaxID=3040122 RepID=UPI002442B945|nr:AMP-binding protein [Streptomyces sp. DH37]MDG9701991.1 phenylacetate--CoA ligase family protein [Streptomyces sp. DH37]
MDGNSHWNPRHETMPRRQLEALQLAKLRNAVGWALESPGLQGALLREAGVVPEDLTSLADVRRIPFLTRDAWMEAQLAAPPFGDILAAPPDVAVRHHLTSGTTGRQPIRVLDGLKDWEWIAEMWCYAFWGFGVRPSDRVFLAFGYGSFIGFWGAHYACEKIGCLVLPGGNMTTETRLRHLLDTGATVLCSTPTYALRLAQEARRLGIDLAAGPVRRVVLSGEPAGSIPATKRLIEAEWGARTADTAGMTELGTIMTFECEAQPGGTHIIEDNFLEEVVDPSSGEPVPYGRMGERVVTSFGRGIIPLLRYRTRDLVVRTPGGHCPCGRTWDLYDGGIQGRVDDMLLVRGTNVYPRALEAVVREYPEVDEFQIHLYTEEGIREEIEVLVETPGRPGTGGRLAGELAKSLAEAAGGLRIGVREAPPGSLPRFELKARRVRDERIVIGSGETREAAE